MDHKKDVLTLMFSHELFSCKENSETVDMVSEYLVKKPFEFYEKHFQPKPKQEILKELLDEMGEEKDEKKKKDIDLELWYKFDDHFSQFTTLFLEMHPFSVKSVTVDEVFELFEEMYYSYQRAELYRKWRKM